MSAACPRRWLIVSLTACSCALLGAGCASTRRAAPGPRLPHALAQRLAGEADSVAASYRAGDLCGAKRQAARLRGDVTRAINARHVPAPFQEEMQGAATSLVAGISCAPPPPQPPQPPGKERGHGHGKGNKKHGGEGGGD